MPPPTVIGYLKSDGSLTSSDLALPADTLIHCYETMVKTRLVDERMVTLQRQGLISFALTSFGEEAAAVGSAAALTVDDWMYPQYRELGCLFYRGYSIKDYIHHMFGDAKDSILGRQMPNHFGSKELNIVTVSSPIGTKIPHAAGSAYAMKLKKEKNIAICYFGEGATSEGDFHAGLNFAAVRKAPAIFFCRNNGYAISTPVKEQFASDGIAPKGIGYGIEAMKIDGNDLFAVFHAVKQAKEMCLAGKGPVLIEAMTYRLGAHSTSDDPTRYRSEEEVKKAKEKCPIKRLFLYLKARELFDEEKNEALKQRILQEINEGIEEAKKTPPPPIESLFEHVYFSMPRHLKEQLQECLNQKSESADA
ncbi:thiamine pyrophosphate-dependent dehydrogenase E1 component subunit alpha [Estrella lausannensis]|uniref:2-oxoisovalerate dehydrogenase subunit alpha n=1 Tax=Estrella lausannensis TaxID=483423 RepID=A0A0H5DR83_9BACT|nr:thiamine pyrophosphate-dependent enzyme [Estrella lausannensis]CRX39077.1 Pyruvate dehydrogenase, E1 component alpha subunit [Estrella lausannensis]